MTRQDVRSSPAIDQGPFGPRWRRALEGAWRRALRPWREHQIEIRGHAVSRAMATLLPCLEKRANAGPAPPAALGMAVADLGAMVPRDVARCWLRSLRDQQLPDGSFPRIAGGGASFFGTSQALRGLLASEVADDAAVSINRAIQWLLDKDAEQATSPRPHELRGVLAAGALAQVAASPIPLDRALRDSAARGIATALARLPLIADAHGLAAAWALQALGDLLAARSIDFTQARDLGARLRPWSRRLMNDPAGRWQWSAWGALCVSLGDACDAEAALARLASWQSRRSKSAGLPEGEAFAAPSRLSELELLGVIAQVAAARRQVAAAFGNASDPLPRSIDVADGRWQRVAATLTELPEGARVMEVGCGSGRFLRRAIENFRNLRYVGVDPCLQLLRELPTEAARRQGELLAIPADDGEFDLVLAIESLEHALWPQAAIAELLRVTRVGGRVLIIDKARRHQALSRAQPWERWFDPEEVCHWLAEGCDHVACEPIAHVECRRHRANRWDKNLFLAWHGRRRITVDSLRDKGLRQTRAA